MPVTLHVGNLKVIDITLEMQTIFLSIMNNKRWHSLRILNDGRSALCEEKTQPVYWNTHITREMLVDCLRIFDSPQQQ